MTSTENRKIAKNCLHNYLQVNIISTKTLLSILWNKVVEFYDVAKKELQRSCFPVNFIRFLKAVFRRNLWVAALLFSGSFQMAARHL